MIQHPTSGYIAKGNEITILRYLHSHVHCNIIHNSQEMETTQVYINWWTDKEDVVYINVCIDSQSNIIHPWERNLATCDNMYGAGSWRHYVKCNKTEKDKYSSPLNNVGVRGIDPFCGWNSHHPFPFSGPASDTKVFRCSSPIVGTLVFTVSHPWIQPTADNAVCIYWKKNPCISASTQFKPM